MTRRTVLGFLLLSALLLVPAAAVSFTGNQGLTGTALLAGISGLLAGLGCGMRVGVGTSVAFGVVGTAGIAWAGEPLLAALVMALFTFAIGLTATYGRSANLILFPVTLGFLIAVPPIDNSGLIYPLWLVAVVLVVSAVYAAVLGAYLGHRLKLPEPAQMSTSRAAAYAIALALMAGFATWLVVERDLRHGGAWLIMTVLIVYRPYLQDAVKVTVQRAAGTVLGCVVAAGFGVFDAPAWLDVIVGLGLLTLALVVRAQPSRPYWQYTAIITPTIVLLEGAGSSVLDTDWQRIFYTLLGAAIAVLVELVLAPIYKRKASAVGLTKY